MINIIIYLVKEKWFLINISIFLLFGLPECISYFCSLNHSYHQFCQMISILNTFIYLVIIYTYIHYDRAFE